MVECTDCNDESVRIYDAGTTVLQTYDLIVGGGGGGFSATMHLLEWTVLLQFSCESLLVYLLTSL
jgi:hypothetical protein